MSQMEFSEWSGEEEKSSTPPVFEKIDCQYCEDVGLCTYCRRGKEAISEFEKEAKTAKKKSKPQKKAA